MQKIDVSRVHIVLSTYFRALDQPKLDLREIEKAMLQVLECHFELILGLLTIPKCVFVEVDKAIFLWPVWHIQPIF